VIEPKAADKALSINYGNTTRFHNLFPVDVADGGGEVCVSIFRSKPLELPITLKIMEYHPFGSQAFIPLSANPYLIAVAAAGELNPAEIKLFKSAPGQGVNYRKGTWHHFSLALDGPSDFLVIDRMGAGENCVEAALSEEDQIQIRF
jgi:ureidoglycolate lyase